MLKLLVNYENRIIVSRTNDQWLENKNENYFVNISYFYLLKDDECW